MPGLRRNFEFISRRSRARVRATYSTRISSLNASCSPRQRMASSGRVEVKALAVSQPKPHPQRGMHLHPLGAVAQVKAARGVGKNHNGELKALAGRAVSRLTCPGRPLVAAPAGPRPFFRPAAQKPPAPPVRVFPAIGPGQKAVQVFPPGGPALHGPHGRKVAAANGNFLAQPPQGLVKSGGSAQKRGQKACALGRGWPTPYRLPRGVSAAEGGQFI